MAAELERNYTCDHCGMRAIVVIEAQASDAMAREQDANSSLGLVKCPSCGLRPRSAKIGSAARVVLLAVGSAIGFWLIGNVVAPNSFANWQTLWTLEPLVLVLAVGLGIVVEIRRWGAAGNVRVVRTLQPSQVKELPKAKAVVRPAVRAPSVPPAPAPVPVAAPVAPIVARALPPPTAPGEPPRFLK